MFNNKNKNTKDYFVCVGCNYNGSLSGCINDSIALYNTAGGIVVAVPAMIAYRFFRSKIDNLVVEMEQQAIKLVEIINGQRK